MSVVARNYKYMRLAVCIMQLSTRSPASPAWPAPSGKLARTVTSCTSSRPQFMPPLTVQPNRNQTFRAIMLK